jgi:phage I-like protein
MILKPMKPTCKSRCRDLTEIPVGDGRPWIHVVERGEYPGLIEIPAGYEVDGYGVMKEAKEVDGATVFSDQVIGNILERYDDENLLIDYEHFSHDASKATEAAGWGIGLRYTADRTGLEMETRWAGPAREKIQQEVYRYISPEFSGVVKYEGGEFKFYPSALTGAGLTNRPKLKVLRPVSVNRESQTTEQTMNYKNMLLKLLKMADTATDEEIMAKLNPAEQEMATSQNRATEIAGLKEELKKLKDEAIEADLERFSAVIVDKDSTKELLQMNRAATVKMLEAQQTKQPATKAASEAPIYQKNRAKAPDGKSLMETEEEATDEATAKFRAIEARAHAIVSERRMTYSNAFEAAKAELRG